LDRGLTYSKLRAAVRAILNGALFVASNRDHVIPVSDGLDPGAGSIVSAIEKAVSRPVDFDAGKPGRWIMDLAFRALGNPSREDVVVIGDRIDTDVEMARAYGVRSILVLTGLTRDSDLEGLGGRLADTIVVRDLSEIRI
jgi:ribonucleotide monophosphatase NagD (HAD superfamily)